MKKDELYAFHQNMANCRKCAQIKEHLKFRPECHGNADSGIMLVSEGAYKPSINAGRYFTKGQLRDALPNLEEHCYLTDVIKCHTDCGKSPNIAKQCLPYLFDEIKLLQPKLILAVGKMPFEMLTGTLWGSFSDIHGTRNKYFYKGIEVVPIIHPSWANKHFPFEPRVENYRKSLRELVKANEA